MSAVFSNFCQITPFSPVSANGAVFSEFCLRRLRRIPPVAAVSLNYAHERRILSDFCYWRRFIRALPAYAVLSEFCPSAPFIRILPIGSVFSEFRHERHFSDFCPIGTVFSEFCHWCRSALYIERHFLRFMSLAPFFPYSAMWTPCFRILPHECRVLRIMPLTPSYPNSEK